jgi:hypothetical protein
MAILTPHQDALGRLINCAEQVGRYHGQFTYGTCSAHELQQLHQRLLQLETRVQEIGQVLSDSFYQPCIQTVITRLARLQVRVANILN